ncbi:MAG: spore germination protein [Oscillospiraceae bacterium]|nr:spore germination protein [Oscillospiraceae bacterium]
MSDSSAHLKQPEAQALSASLTDNLRMIQTVWKSSADLIVTKFSAGSIGCAMLSCEGMVSSSLLSQMVFQPINSIEEQFSDADALFSHLKTKLLLSTDCQTVRNFAEISRMLSAGFAVFFADGTASALAVGVQGYASRSIAEPESEQNIYGAKEGFTENIRTNLSLLRRRMKSPLLTMQMCTAGSVSRTDLCICYLQDRVDMDFVAEIQKKLENLPLETVLSSGYVRPFLEEHGSRLFHSVGTTERPDVLCAKMLEGRIAVLIDGTPFALVLPQLFWELFQTMDDYNVPPAYATMIRLLKLAALAAALLLPAFYLAIAVWHPELLNRTLLQILSEAEQRAPFSLAVEMLGVLFMFEVIREAGIRLPKAVGGAVSIVGGLIIGDAAVNSGLVSTPVLTVTALAVTAGFVIPELHSVMSLLRPLLILAASVCGLSGIAVVSAAILLDLCAAEVCGFPVTAPFAPLRCSRLRDVFVRIGFKSLSQGNFHVSEVRNARRTDKF